MTRLYIVRHGETKWNATGKMQGHSDIDLNEKGRQQAQAMAKYLLPVYFDRAFSSDLVRAKRTAEIILLEKQLAVVAANALREQSFGRYEGMDRNEFYTLFKKWDQMTEKEKHHFKLSEDMESNEQAASRLITFLREISIAYPSETILIVAHGSLMRSFLCHLGYWTYSMNNRLSNTGYIVVDSDGLEFKVLHVEGVEKRV